MTTASWLAVVRLPAIRLELAVMAACLALNVVQSADDRKPLAELEAGVESSFWASAA
jgi:hypothetical protein